MKHLQNRRQNPRAAIPGQVKRDRPSGGRRAQRKRGHGTSPDTPGPPMGRFLVRPEPRGNRRRGADGVHHRGRAADRAVRPLHAFRRPSRCAGGEVRAACTRPTHAGLVDAGFNQIWRRIDDDLGRRRIDQRYRAVQRSLGRAAEAWDPVRTALRRNPNPGPFLPLDRTRPGAGHPSNAPPPMRA
jgi:hypothetical protein